MLANSGGALTRPARPGEAGGGGRAVRRRRPGTWGDTRSEEDARTLIRARALLLQAPFGDALAADRTPRPELLAFPGGAGALIRGSGTGDVQSLYAIARRDDVAFNVTWVPLETPRPRSAEDFDRALMQRLNDFACDRLRSGQARSEAPL